MVTWKINQLQRYSESGAVCKVTYEVAYVQNNATLSGESFEMELTGDVTIPFADLTEATVIGWVKTALGTDEVEAKEAAVVALVCSGLEEGVPW